MIQEVAEYLKNKDDAIKHERQGMIELLGSQQTVEELAAIWKKSKADLKLAKAALMLDFCNYQDFSKQDMFFYRLGLEAFPKLFEDCCMDVDSRKLLKNKSGENKGQV